MYLCLCARTWSGRHTWCCVICMYLCSGQQSTCQWEWRRSGLQKGCWFLGGEVWTWKDPSKTAELKRCALATQLVYAAMCTRSICFCKLDCTINCHCVQMSSYIHHVHINLRCSLLYMSLSHAGPLPAGWGSPPPTTCHPVQRQCSGCQLAGTHYCPQETVSSDEDWNLQIHWSRMYRSWLEPGCAY